MMRTGKPYNPFMDFVDFEKLAKELNVLLCKAGYTSSEARASAYAKHGKQRIYLNGKKADGFIEQNALSQWEVNIRHEMLYRLIKDHLSIPSGRIS